MVFNKIKKNINRIKTQIIDNFKFNNIVYNLACIICMPYAHHYTGILINMDNDYYNLKKGFSLFL